MKPVRILFIASHRFDRAPGQRFRFEQYFEYLRANGFECTLSYIVDEAADKLLYKPGQYLKKAGIYRRAVAIRKADVKKVQRGDYDIVFIFREALLTGSIRFEKAFAKTKAKLVFDFDDAIWHLDVSDANKKLSFLKNPQKTGDIIALCHRVFAGNAYLANYAKQFNNSVTIIPTTIDTSEYRRIAQPPRDYITIGWSGSITTIKHFEYALPFLRILKKKYGDKIRIHVIGDGNYVNEELGIKGIAWNRADEIAELSKIDIGIMPLPDDEWANGKCGLKGLQYMALEIPTLMSPVGVNTEIIQDGVNGYLATATDEWVAKIEMLLASEELRKRIGAAARETVLRSYSVEALKETYVKEFRELVKNN